MIIQTHHSKRNILAAAMLWFLMALPCRVVPAPLPINIYGPPEAATSLDGNSRFTPFDVGPARFQQLYDSSAFVSLADTGGGWIDALFFRVDPSVGHPFIATIRNAQINLSTTLRPADGLSAVFDENVGADDLVVVGPGSMHLLSNGGGGVSTFDLFFRLQHRFFYDPTDGNLLLDFRIHEGIDDGGMPGGVIILDAFDVTGDSVSSVYAPSLPTGGRVSSLGLATDFVITPIPEPTTLALLAVGLGALVLAWKQRQKPNTKQ